MLKIESLFDEDKNNPIAISETSGEQIDSKAGVTKTTIRKITQLKPALKDERRVNVFVDQKFCCSLDVAQVIDLRLKVGTELTEMQLQQLKQASEFGKVYQYALEWVLARPRSRKETIDYLKQRQIKRRQLNFQRQKDEKPPLAEISDETRLRVFDLLCEKGYVDDEKFAKFFVENRNLKQGISKKKLSLELRKKGVAEETIQRVLSKTSRDDMNELRKIIQKKSKRYDKVKLTGYLVRQGFDYEMIKAALDEI